MAKIVIGLLMITVFVLIMLFLLIVGLSIALLVFSRRGTRRQGPLIEKETL
ncbi:MAG: hypothetical protein ACE144_05300 [Thermodesulfobacteriota bacterium]